MPSKISSNLKTVIDLVTPEVLGIFWISNVSLRSDLLGFDEFNYLFDGLLTQYLSEQKKSESSKHSRSNIFFTQNFNQKLFLTHIKEDQETTKVLKEQIGIIQENNPNRKKILVFNTTSQNWTAELSREYLQFEFLDLALSS